MKVGVPRETAAGERRVAVVPESVTRLKNGGHEVAIDDEGGGAVVVKGGYPENGGHTAPPCAGASGPPAGLYYPAGEKVAGTLNWGVCRGAR